jgi:hypothetical protein
MFCVNSFVGGGEARQDLGGGAALVGGELVEQGSATGQLPLAVFADGRGALAGQRDADRALVVVGPHARDQAAALEPVDHARGGRRADAGGAGQLAQAQRRVAALGQRGEHVVLRWRERGVGLHARACALGRADEVVERRGELLELEVGGGPHLVSMLTTSLAP